jgi:hypothetical protein
MLNRFNKSLFTKKEEVKSTFFSNPSLNFKKFKKNILTDSLDNIGSVTTQPIEKAGSSINYKLFCKTDDMGKTTYFIVPRESFIKTVIHAFNESHPIAKREQVLIEGYNGVMPSKFDESDDEKKIQMLKITFP